MGTNFYWKVDAPERREVILPTGATLEIGRGFDDMDPKVHIGKRSAAGYFCWDCNVTLAVDGNASIHMGKTKWHPACPKCGKSEKDGYPTRFEKAAELQKEAIEKAPTGVRRCCSFSWAQEPEEVFKVLEARPEEVLIVDEYDAPYKCIEFLEMLNNSCPVHFRDSIGRQFS